MNQQIQKFVIVGGGTAGWMAAAALSNYLKGRNVTIVLVESTDIGTVGVGEATIPSIQSFHLLLGINEKDFMRETQATFKLGIEFEDWYQLKNSFFHPFGSYGMSLNGIDFHHWWLKAKELGNQHPLGDYSLPSVMAKHGVFAQPLEAPSTSLLAYRYAYHFDAGLYATFLKKYASNLGVIHEIGNVTNAKLNNDNGFIDSLILDDGREISGEFFIDCSGFRSLLINGALNIGFEDWGHWLPCNRAIAIQSQKKILSKPYTKSKALDAGWRWRIPLQNRVGNGYVYCNNYISEDEATSTLSNELEAESITDPKVLKFSAGMRKKFWSKNCIALGLASGFLEPLESTSISLIQTGIARLLLLFPEKDCSSSLSDEANRLSKMEYESIRDFIILHYKASQRSDTEFWRDVSSKSIPSTLQHKIDVFKETGYHVRYEQDFFQNENWLSMYAGFNIWSKNYDYRINKTSNHEIKNTLNVIREKLHVGASVALQHDDFLKKYIS